MQLENTKANFGFPYLILELLKARGIESDEQIQKLLSPSLKDLRSPFVLKDMDKAVARLHQARERNELVCVYADFDLDGTSACALLLEAFELLGFKRLTFYQPKRLSEGYGLHAHAMEQIKQEGADLVVTVDVGITAIEAVETAKRVGLEVIITDHHLPKETLPDAFAIVNPNSGMCTSGLGHLSGVGVAFYLALALRKYFMDHNLLEKNFDPKTLLDCLVIGTLTDMVPLVDENRALVRHGLMQLAQTKRPGLKILMHKLRLNDRNLSSQDVSILFSPKINALSRMETGVRALDLFIEKDPVKAQNIADQVLAINTQRKTLQAEAEKKAREQHKQKNRKYFSWEFSKEYHKGIVGLVATKLSEEFSVPSFVGHIDENNKITGSSRLPNKSQFSLVEILEACSSSLLSFGGHAAAAGFSLEIDKADEFALALEKYFIESVHQKEIKAKELIYDLEARVSELDADLMNWIEKLEPYGSAFAPPRFLLRNLRLVDKKEMTGGHIRARLLDPVANSSTVALFFSPPPSVKNLDSAALDVVVELQWNYFAGNKSLQVLIKDYQIL